MRVAKGTQLLEWVTFLHAPPLFSPPPFTQYPFPFAIISA
jgi:hypothetical protein